MALPTAMALPTVMALPRRLLACVAIGVFCGHGLAGCGSRSDNRKQIPPPRVTFERAEDSACAALAEAARGCGLLQGEGEPLCSEPSESLSRCYTDCLSRAECADLSAFLCRSSVSLAALETTRTCVAACDGQAVACTGEQDAEGDEDAGGPTALDDDDDDDGGVSLDGGAADAGVPVVPAEWACDGVDDCAGGGDEAGCDGLDNALACDGGETLSKRFVCDGIQDCEDGEDERDCEGLTYDCLGGQRVAARLRCDGRTDCRNGRDEVGCPPALALRCN